MVIAGNLENSGHSKGENTEYAQTWCPQASSVYMLVYSLRSICYADADLLVLHNYYQILVAALSPALSLNRS